MKRVDYSGALRTSNVLTFSKTSIRASARNTQAPRTHGAATFSAHKPRSPTQQLPLLALCDAPTIPDRLRRTLEKLDREQVRIVEIIATAIERGAL